MKKDVIIKSLIVIRSIVKSGCKGFEIGLNKGILNFFCMLRLKV